VTAGTAICCGIRSHYIKLAGLRRALEDGGGLAGPVSFVDLRQHHDAELAERYLRWLGLTWDHLAAPPPVGLDAAGRAGHLLAEASRALHVRDPEVVVVFGDADVSMLTAVAAFRAGRTVVHVEAGVRTGQPTVEEQNRILIDSVASAHCASSRLDYDTLCREGREATSVLTGDLVRDVVQSIDLDEGDAWAAETLPDGFALATLHRAENTTGPAILTEVLAGLRATGQPIVLVTTPRTRAALREVRADLHPDLEFSGLDYPRMLAAVRAARYFLTDSGALQRESFYLRRRCLVRQDRAFWRGLVEAGVHREVPAARAAIADGCRWLDECRETPPACDDFGNGDAGASIVEVLRRLEPGQ
jgi:UDP-GlcNAc3NAcA epimerase